MKYDYLIVGAGLATFIQRRLRGFMYIVTVPIFFILLTQKYGIM